MEKTKLKLHTWPEKILKKKCRKVTVIDDRIRQLLDEMRSVMVINKGVGLAANQVGVDLSLIVVDGKDRVFKLINPVIVKKEGRTIFNEGCLSFPEIELEIKRAKKVWLSALDEKGEPIELEADDTLAVIFQHEIDQINGIVFTDRVRFFQKIKLRNQLKQLVKK